MSVRAGEGFLTSISKSTKSILFSHEYWIVEYFQARGEFCAFVVDEIPMVTRRYFCTRKEQYEKNTAFDGVIFSMIHQVFISYGEEELFVLRSCSICRLYYNIERMSIKNPSCTFNDLLFNLFCLFSNKRKLSVYLLAFEALIEYDLQTKHRTNFC